ncbi:MAG: hypothetical protein EZS28_000663 [Streblomastix strix]|uniref:Uncharacterized protein n=1 Tax=Streblomastix strix TaxID=222440 RepID=A0A5J4X9P8_9EUKA|nr:MAG: hypothetical protein EZS28_000663 [Streblomastix strix]
MQLAHIVIPSQDETPPKSNVNQIDRHQSTPRPIPKVREWPQTQTKKKKNRGIRIEDIPNVVQKPYDG